MPVFQIFNVRSRQTEIRETMSDILMPLFKNWHIPGLTNEVLGRRALEREHRCYSEMDCSTLSANSSTTCLYCVEFVPSASSRVPCKMETSLVQLSSSFHPAIAKTSSSV